MKAMFSNVKDSDWCYPINFKPVGIDTVVCAEDHVEDVILEGVTVHDFRPLSKDAIVYIYKCKRCNTLYESSDGYLLEKAQAGVSVV